MGNSPKCVTSFTNVPKVQKELKRLMYELTLKHNSEIKMIHCKHCCLFLGCHTLS